jgi:hypothetical protein
MQPKLVTLGHHGDWGAKQARLAEGKGQARRRRQTHRIKMLADPVSVREDAIEHPSTIHLVRS